MTATTLLQLGEAYLWLGGVFAVTFLLLGLDRVEPNARGAYAFRALIVPGLILIWPLAAWRWAALARGDDLGCARHTPPRRTQAALALALGIAVPSLLLGAMVLRQAGPLERAPVLLEPPVEAAE
ncbi:MAG: hypothetical protein AAFQ88_05380 [Pseudomonadota bacterium]